MDLHLDALNDDELKYLVKLDTQLFLEPIVQRPRSYHQFNIMLGNKKNNNILVQKNLPGIAAKQYKKNDNNFVLVMEKAAELKATEFVEIVGEILQREITTEEILALSNEDIAKIINQYKNREDANLDYDLLWIQMKLVGFDDVDTRKDGILVLCEPIPDDVIKEANDETDDNNDSIKVEKDTTNTEISENSIKKPKPRRLTPEEKAAKAKAAIEAKEKEKDSDIQEPEKEVLTNTTDDNDNNFVEYEEFNEDEIEISDNEPENMEKTVISDTIDKPEKEIEHMGYYVGVVSTVGNYYNFLPIGCIENGEFNPYTESDLDDLLPKSVKHNINLFYKHWDSGDISQMYKSFEDGGLMLLNCDIDDLEENRQSDGQLNQTGYRINALNAYSKGTISNLSARGFYRIIPKTALIDDISSKKIIRIDSDEVKEGESILVNFGDGFYGGPYNVKHLSGSDEPYINIQTVEGKYFTSGYSSDSTIVIHIQPSVDVENWIGYNSWIYYEVPKNSKRISMDLITDKQLLESFKSSLGKTTEDYKNLNIEYVLENLELSQIIGDNIPGDIRKNRKERLREIMTSEEELTRISSDAYDIICDLLLNNESNEKTQQLLNVIIEKRPDLLDKLPGVKSVQTKIENTRAELEKLESQRDEVKKQINETEEQKRASREVELDSKISEKKERFDEISEKLELAETADALNTKVEQLKKDEAYYEEHNARLQADSKNLESNFIELVNRNSEKIASITFDGFMSSKMLKAAAEWESKEQKSQLDNIVSILNGSETESMEKDQLIQYLVKSIQTYRPGYSKNAIINIIACMSQGFLTVFSGMPGCGKTSICNIVSKVLGLDRYEKVSSELKDVRRYIPVSVERGWSSKRDFIGYYNPLTKAFEENNREVFDGLRILDMEQKKNIKKYPFIILLDEANLSPMEYYWADFMNICDDLGDNSSINLGNDNVFKIPETLHFLATINNDHTTETLSPRLIDRAWIISLPKAGSLISVNELPEDQIKNVSWEDIRKVFTIAGYERKEFDRETQSIYEGVKERLLKQGIFISPRVDVAIQKYWITCSQIMEEDEYGNSPSRIALDYAVAQKVLPKIVGNGEDFETVLKELQAYCDEKGLNISGGIISKIIERGNMKMKYYQFFY